MPDEKRKPGRPRKGGLQFKNGVWYAVVTADVDGEAIRKWINLETDNKAAARRKLARISEQPAEVSVGELERAANALETYSELAERVHIKRTTEGLSDVTNERSRERTWILPEIGELPITSIRPAHISGIYESARAADKSLATLRHLRAILRSRFAVAIEDEIIKSNPADAVRVPKIKTDRRERAVVTDIELDVYLAWTPKDERAQAGTRERQTMSVLARTFGGLRTGDMHSMTWGHFDTSNDGAFMWGKALRKKTARPQTIVVPEALRPILRDWWQRQGKPTSGLVFPALRGKHAGEGVKHGVSHAAGLRRDLQSAFKAYREQHPDVGVDIVPGEGSARWRELFEETEFTRPVDFHSWRRAFVQVLADIGLSAQQAQKLAGHAAALIRVRRDVK